MQRRPHLPRRLQPVAQAAGMEQVPARQHLGRLHGRGSTAQGESFRCRDRAVWRAQQHTSQSLQQRHSVATAALQVSVQRAQLAWQAQHSEEDLWK